MAAEKTYDNLDMTLKEANEHRNEWFEGVYKCQKTDTLFDVMEKIVKAEVIADRQNTRLVSRTEKSGLPLVKVE